MTARHTVIDTRIGSLTLVAENASVTGIYFPGHWTKPDDTAWGDRVDIPADPVFERTQAQLEEYFDGERTTFDLPLAPVGNEFQQRVWEVLERIPFGQTVTYGQIAAEIGGRTVAQMVGQAVGRNPVSIVIPCHRVVGADGSLTGYAGGLERKLILLELEEPPEIAASKLF
ncbi:methylated-DNA--[protein]-cysteine S-methyltransferase [Okibacterium fritillariae]|uniref:Methylated-DNA--protein-cysteine methyltransferase n=1 Tax=Okibacterium fritillariae TaxID=123320 RepID=A0A1T5IG84_9MICO|nr:methylated-DNA--[protein]-cysteine S-methyltransferase [Okibacterium fritillariae]SKC38174.1 methylated-DNA-[protein]-cysteine S-methyltransferase [Okibacterium fritillariae]